MTQAVIRGLENAYPITTMVDDHRTQWTDYKFGQYKVIIDDEIEQILNILRTGKYKGIKYSNMMTFGKGKISNMKETSPLCWEYLNIKLKKIKINNTEE
jgi:protein involved in temperature-dependent protein secretion